MTELSRSERVSQEQALSMTKDNDVQWTFEHKMGSSANIQQVIFHVKDSSGTVVLALASDTESDQFDLSTTGFCTISIEAADTNELSASEQYDYAVKMIDNSSLRYTPWWGTFTVRDDIVDDSLSAPSLTWQTRQELETEIAALETEIANISAIFYVSALSAAASSGASAIVLLNSGIVEATDTIRVELDDGTYEEHTVLSVVSNTVNFDSSTLGDDCAAGNVAAKVV